VSERNPRPRLALGIALSGLAVCGVVLSFYPTDHLADPLTLALAVCAVCATATYVPLGGKLLIDASFVPELVAIAFLGPWPTFAILAVSELGAWGLQRYRLAVVPINLFSVGSAGIAASAAFASLSLSPGLGFYLALGAAGALTLTLNYVLLVALIGLLDGYVIGKRLGAQSKIVPALAINVCLGVAVSDVYAQAGLRVIVFVLALILAFNYMVRQALLARNKTREVEELAAMRSALVNQTLDVEERERRGLAESLHDGPIQSLLAARQDLEEGQHGDPSSIDRAQAAVDQSISQLRDAVSHLHPSVLEAGGLSAAVAALARAQSKSGGFVVDARVDPSSEGIHDKLLFSLIREFLSNAVKHSNASRVRVNVERSNGAVLLEVSDNGDGFNPGCLSASVADGHIGLAAAAERVERAHGSLKISARDGNGTEVEVAIPLATSEASAPRPRLDEALASVRQDQ